MNIDIKPNPYTIPRESRREVVQKVVECIVSFVSNMEREGDFRLVFTGEHPRLYVGTCKRNDDLYEKLRIENYPFDKNYDTIRVRSCEMKAVFKALQDAGYYIFEISFGYNISKKPYLSDKHAERQEFKWFID